MNENGTNSTVRWEVLPGLPGSGPSPFHFHLGHPSPWTEGFVVRFWKADGNEWVGNFQGKAGLEHKSFALAGGNSVVVLAMDNFYLVDANIPGNYVTIDSQWLVDDVMLDDERKMLFVAASTSIFAFGRDRGRLWTQLRLGGFDAQLTECADGVLRVEVEEELGGARKTVQLSAKDGAILP